MSDRAFLDTNVLVYLSLWDALILEAAVASGCKRLLSEVVQ